MPKKYKLSKKKMHDSLYPIERKHFKNQTMNPKGVDIDDLDNFVYEKLRNRRKNIKKIRARTKDKLDLTQSEYGISIRKKGKASATKFDPGFAGSGEYDRWKHSIGDKPKYATRHIGIDPNLPENESYRRMKDYLSDRPEGESRGKRWGVGKRKVPWYFALSLLPYDYYNYYKEEEGSHKRAIRRVSDDFLPEELGPPNEEKLIIQHLMNDLKKESDRKK